MTTPPLVRRCALCTAKLPRETPPWAPEGPWGLCYGCCEGWPASAHRALLRGLESLPGPYVVRVPMSGSYAAEASLAHYRAFDQTRAAES